MKVPRVRFTMNRKKYLRVVPRVRFYAPLGDNHAKVLSLITARYGSSLTAYITQGVNRHGADEISGVYEVLLTSFRSSSRSGHSWLDVHEQAVRTARDLRTLLKSKSIIVTVDSILCLEVRK